MPTGPLERNDLCAYCCRPALANRNAILTAMRIGLTKADGNRLQVEDIAAATPNGTLPHHFTPRCCARVVKHLVLSPTRGVIRQWEAAHPQ